MERRRMVSWLVVALATWLTASLLAAPAHAQAADSPRYALLVGVDAYAPNPDGTPNANALAGPRNDVAMMKKLLVDRFRFRDDGTQVTTLLGKDATHAAIRDAFARLIDRAAATPGATVLFYFSGHGSQYPDENGDEGDGMDETLVAYDSRVGSGSDILDDELAQWQAELMRRAPTTNMTYIFDSCHSGTGLKLLSSSRNRVARYLPPRPSLTPRPVAPGSKDVVNALLPEGRTYALLAGSDASTLSYEDAVPTGAGPVVHGFFTYELDRLLRQDPNTSYDALRRRIAVALRTESPDQIPQAEGAIDRLVLNGSGDREDPFIPILGREPDGTFRIGGGAVLGLRKGAILAVYKAATLRLSGEAGKIGDARIVTLGNSESIAEFTAKLAAPLPLDAKVAVVAPAFGLDSMKANLAELPSQPTLPADRALLDAVATRLRAGKFVAVAASSDNWDVAVAKGCRKNDRLYLAGETPPAGCVPAYYLRARNGTAALMGFSTAAGPMAASDLASRIEDRARQENIRAIDNQLSPIDGLISIRLMRVAVTTGPDGRPVAQPQPPEPVRGVTPMKIGERFMLRIDNDSDMALYVAVYDLQTGGKNFLVGSTVNGDLISPHHSMIVTSQPWKTGGPTGLESFKVIATTRSDVNFRVLDNQRAPSRGPRDGPLEWLLSSTVDARARDAGPDSIDLDSWTTTRLDLDIMQ